MKVVLVVEDDRKTAASIRLYLEHAGFLVHCLHDGSAALDYLRRERPLAVILDGMLPGMDGLDLCRAIRRESETPVLMVSARVEEPDRVLGFKRGVDDYITKPFSPRELIARLQAVLRRAGVSGEPHGCTVQTDKHLALFDGNSIGLSPTEFRVFQLFMDSPGRVYTRTQVIEGALGSDFDGFDRTVDAHIMNIRKKVRKAGGPKRIIETVFGIGYRLVAKP